MVILTRNEALDVLAKVLAAPLTTRLRGIPTEVPVGKEDGLTRDSVVALDNIAPVRRSYLTHRITRLSEERMLAVCRALAIATSC